jgi:nicotinamidase-related amidase
MSSPSDPYGSAPDRSPAVLLLIDVVNDLEFEGGDALLANALPVARELAALKAAAKRSGIPAVYVNDNFGRWRSDFRTTVRHCLDDGVRGAPIAALLRPEDDDYFVLKPRHSGFYLTPLDLLLQYFEAGTLILTGIAGNSCVLVTAQDAHTRGFRLTIPADCTASISRDDNAWALRHCARWLRADVRRWRDLDLDALARGDRRPAAASA